MSIYDKIFPPRLLTLPNGKQVSKPRSRAPLAAVILVAMTILSVEVTGFDMGVLVSRIKEFFVILGDMIPPQWGYVAPDLAAPVRHHQDVPAGFLHWLHPGGALRHAGLYQYHSQPGGRGSYAAAPEYHPHLAYPGLRPDRHLHFRPGYPGWHYSHRHLYLRLHRQDSL